MIDGGIGLIMGVGYEGMHGIGFLKGVYLMGMDIASFRRIMDG